MNAADKPVRVLLLQKYMAPYRQPLFSAMADSGRIDLTVLCYGTPERRRLFENADAGTFRQLQSASISVRAGYERNIEVPLGLPATIARSDADVIVCAPDWGGLAALRHCKRTGARPIVWSEATDVTEAEASVAKRQLRRWFYRNAAVFVVPGRLSRDYLRSMGARGPYVEVRNCIDEASFRQSEDAFMAKFATPGKRIITFSGSLVERKGVGLLLDAFATACALRPSAAASTVLRIVGTGPIALTSPRLPNVEFTGHLRGHDYYAKMQQSHVFVMPSLSDCNPLVVIEALNCGAALILSDGVGNHREALRGNGRLVPRGNVEALANALAWVMTRPASDVAAMARRSRDLATEFDTERAADRFIDAVAQAMLSDRSGLVA